MGRAPRSSHRATPIRLAAALCLLISVGVGLLTGCAPDAKSAAQQNKTKLDTELTTAQNKAGVPAILLAPIVAQENTLATSSGTNYQSAADGYTTLYNKVVALEKLTPSQVQARATTDLQTLQASLATTEGSGVADVTTAAKVFDPTVTQAQQQLDAAKSAKDYFAADGYILQQSGAVTQILPVYQQIQALDKLVSAQAAALAQKPGASHTLECATEGGEIASFGVVPAQFWNKQSDYPIFATHPVQVTSPVPAQTFYFSGWPAQDLTAFKAAQTAGDFTVLGVQLQTQVSELTADAQPAALAQAQIAAVVARFQGDVDTYTTDAQANNAFLASHRQSAKDVPDYRSVWVQSNGSTGFAPPDDFYPNVPDFTVDGKYAQQASQDAAALAAAKTSSDLSALVKTVAQQEQGIAFALVKVKAYYDTNITLLSLVNQGQSTTTNVTYNGTLFKTPNAYEYADDSLRYDARDTVGIKDAQVRLDQAAYREGYDSSDEKAADYQGIEDEAQMFIHNLSAMITNLAQMPKDNKARQAWSMTQHQTDVDLLAYYGLQNTKVVVVSLREQKARLYENGKLVVVNGQPDAFDVTTGSPDKPTVPGLHCALPPLKGPPKGDLFKSSEPPGSPFYYSPTPVHYSFGYSLYGYYMHDGWWRDKTEMGYLTNLPHYDPEAFNGGSHGCINFHYANGDMGKVYAFSTPGIPILVY
jgi:hypothetical protein